MVPVLIVTISAALDEKEVNKCRARQSAIQISILIAVES